MTTEEREREPADDRPPICPACGVTMGMTVDEEGSVQFVCLECGYKPEQASGRTIGSR